jgi:hypothetical protein
MIRIMVVEHRVAVELAAMGRWWIAGRVRVIYYTTYAIDM